MASLRLKGLCASPGFAAGVVWTLGAAADTQRIVGGPMEEAEALKAAIARAIADIEALAAAAEGDAADMLAFQAAMLGDDALSEWAFAAIAAGIPADQAWRSALSNEIGGYEAADDAYFRARAGDLADMRDRVDDLLHGRSAVAIKPGGVLLADDLTPSRFLGADWTGGAILLRKGSATSHVAMLARARGVPMIVELPATDMAGCHALIDAATGVVLVDPTPSDQDAFAAARAAATRRAEDAATYLRRPAVTADGTPVAVLINVADVGELDGIDPAICDGIGLVRTELMFEGKALPDEETQYAAYARITTWAAGRPVTFRTLDAGGDKPIAGLTPEAESNPFLGVRGVRLTLQRPDVFLPQLRALARAAALGPVEVMIPMASLPAELEASRALLNQACAALGREGVAHRLPTLGMMVEVPAAALTLDLFDAAFLSIGSNDLTQYLMAAGRDIAGVSAIADPAHEAVMRLIGVVADHGARTGVKVSLCGDAGGDERLIPLLLARGVRALSMAPRLIGGAKRAIAGVTLGGGHG